MQLGHKVCSVCGTEKPLEEFIGKRGSQCISCTKAIGKDRLGASPKSWTKYIVTQARSNAKKLDRDFDLTGEQVFDLWNKQGGMCALSGLPMQHHPSFVDFNASIDRIDSSLGYTIDNIQLVCWRVNEMKNDLTEPHFFWWLRALVANDNKEH